MMHPDLHSALVDAHTRELLAAGGAPRPSRRPLRAFAGRLFGRRRPRAVTPLPGQPVAEVRIRWAFADDAPALVRLAEDVGRGAPRAPVLLAEVDGRVGAALSLCDGDAIASPAGLGEDALDLLAVRAAQLGPASRAAAPQWRVSA